jgi:hypothetical protein
MKKFTLQLFADDANDAGGSDPAQAVSGDKAVADQSKEQKEQKDQKNDRTTAKYSDDDLDKILGKRFARWQEEQKKAVDEAKKLAEMNAQQKAEYERDQMRKELEGYKRKDAISEMTKTARKMLSDGGVSISDELLAMMVTTDANETKAAIDSYIKLHTEAVEKAVKDRLKGEPPRKGTGGTVAPMTKAQILAIRDPELRQKKMLENKELFNF